MSEFFFFDDSIFKAFEEDKNLVVIGAVYTSNYSDFKDTVFMLKKKFNIEREEAKWNDSHLQRQIGKEKYQQYKMDFAQIIFQFFSGCFSVTQSNKNDALKLLISGKKISKKSPLIFDADLIEKKEEKEIENLLQKFQVSEKDSKEELGLQAADFFVGMMKLIIQQNDANGKRTFLVETPGYGAGRVPAEWLLRMQTRNMMNGISTESQDGYFENNLLGQSVFLSKNLSVICQQHLEEIFAKVYMGCIH